MYRGTTPSLSLDIDGYDLSDYTIFVTIVQNNKIIDLTGDRLNVTYYPDRNSTNILLTLSQVETLTLSDGYVKLQLRAIDSDKNCIASDIKSFSIKQILKEGVIEYVG